MAEFKKLGAVEAVETVSDAASVLIEENGIIKRAPKDEIGGAGSSETPDLVININEGAYQPITGDIITFAEGSIDNVLSALSEKRIPIVKLRFFKEVDPNYSYYASELMANVYRYGSELYFSYIYPMTFNGVIYNAYMRFTTDGDFEVHHIYSTTATEMS